MNYSTHYFTPADNAILDKKIRGAWFIMGFILFLFFILGLVMMIPHDRSGYAWLAVGLLALVACSLLAPGFARLYGDRTDQIKYIGEFPVEKVVVAGKYSTSFYLKVPVDRKGRKLQVRKELYDIILPNEVIYVEFGARSNTLFRLMKNGQEIAL